MAGDVGTEFQLRRAGMPATVMGVKDVLRLSDDVVKLGRHSGNDFYLDSAKHSCLISRWHAEIQRVNHGGLVRYIIRDNSLNGTYVNDFRVKGNCVLEDGDLVTFGHVNGKNVAPGERASQGDSEFLFKFERMGGPEGGTVEVVDESQDLETPVDLPVNIINIVPEGGSPVVSTADPRTPPRVASSQETPGGEVGKMSNVSRRRLIHDSTGTVVLRDISNSPKCKGTELVSLDQLMYYSPVKKEGYHGYSCSNDSIIGDAVAMAENFGNSDSEDDIFDLGVGAKVTAPQVVTLVNKPLELNAISHVKVKSEDLNMSEILETEPSAFRPVPPITRVVTSPKVMTSPKATTPGARRISITVGQMHSAPSSISSISQLKPAARAQPKLEPVDPAVPCTSANNKLEIASLFDVTGQLPGKGTVKAVPPVVSGKHPPARSSVSGQMSRGKVSNRGKRIPEKAPPPASNRGHGGSQALKRKRGKSWSRGRPTKRSTSQRASLETEEDDDDEDTIWHYDGDRCDSYDCSEPLSAQVSWVQCDDCDKWYHTVCAGCNYDVVRLGNTEFHCGCV